MAEDDNAKKKQRAEKEWKLLQELRDLEKGTGYASWGDGAAVLFDTMRTIKYIKNGLAPATGLLDMQEELDIEKKIQDSLPAGRWVLVKKKYGVDLETGGWRFNKVVDAEVNMGGLIDEKSVPFRPDPFKKEGFYYVRIGSSKPGFSVDESSLTPEQRQERAAKEYAKAIEVLKCQQGAMDACKDAETKDMAGLLDTFQMEYDRALDRLKLVDIPATWQAADPSDLNRWKDRIFGKDKDSDVDDKDHDVDDDGQPKDKQKPKEPTVEPAPEPVLPVGSWPPPPTTPGDKPKDPGTKPADPGTGGKPADPGTGGKPADPEPIVGGGAAGGGATGGGAGVIAAQNLRHTGVIADPRVQDLLEVQGAVQRNHDAIYRYAQAQLRAVRGQQQSFDAMIRPAKPMGPYKVDPVRLRALVDRSDDDWKIRGLTRFSKTFFALLAASDELNDFYGASVEDGYDDDRLYNNMRLFGFFKRPEHPLAVGDVVSLADPMAEDGFNWAVVIATNGGKLAEALICGIKDKPYKVRKSSFGQPTRVWCPALTRVLDDESPAGQFWGPNLSRISAIYGETNYVPITALIPQVFADRYPITDLDSLRSRLGHDLRVLSKNNPAVPGAILLGADETFGIVAREARVRGFTDEAQSAVAWHNYRSFPARYIWYPRLDA